MGVKVAQQIINSFLDAPETTDYENIIIKFSHYFYYISALSFQLYYLNSSCGVNSNLQRFMQIELGNYVN